MTLEPPTQHECFHRTELHRTDRVVEPSPAASYIMPQSSASASSVRSGSSAAASLIHQESSALAFLVHPERGVAAPSMQSEPSASASLVHQESSSSGSLVQSESGAAAALVHPEFSVSASLTRSESSVAATRSDAMRSPITARLTARHLGRIQRLGNPHAGHILDDVQASRQHFPTSTSIKRVRKKCLPHGRVPYDCVDCGGERFCKHRKMEPKSNGS